MCTNQYRVLKYPTQQVMLKISNKDKHFVDLDLQTYIVFKQNKEMSKNVKFNCKDILYRGYNFYENQKI